MTSFAPPQVIIEVADPEKPAPTPRKKTGGSQNVTPAPDTSTEVDKEVVVVEEDDEGIES